MGRSGRLRAENDYYIRDLIEDPSFHVRPDGRIWRTRGPVTKLCGRIDKEGYVEVYYKGRRLKAHRIVYAKFNGRLQCDLVVEHSDGKPSNNRPDNLIHCTQAKNEQYKHRRRERDFYESAA